MNVLKIKRHPAEIPLFLLSSCISILIIAVVIVSFFGIFYAAIFFLCDFGAHIISCSYIKGNGIKVTKDHFPDVYKAVERINKLFGSTQIPDIYIMQSNGILNAFAKKFLFRKTLVIYSKLLEECEGNDGALDMVLGHELGHLYAGHLRWSLLTFGGHFVPFLSKALSRAREYTADRYGAACVQNKNAALEGLLILIGGKYLLPKISVHSFAQQANNINTGLMRLGEWSQNHPSLVRRICALDPELSNYNQEKRVSSFFSGIFWLFLLNSTFLLILTTMYMLLYFASSYLEFLTKQSSANKLTSSQTYEAKNTVTEDKQPELDPLPPIDEADSLG